MNPIETLSNLKFPVWRLENVTNPLPESDVRDESTSTLDMDAFQEAFPGSVFPSSVFPLPQEAGIHITGTKTTGVVLMNPISLLSSLMDQVKWKELFPSIVADAKTPWKDSLPELVDGDKEPIYAAERRQFAQREAALVKAQVPGAEIESQTIQIHARIQALSPWVSVRELIFTRSWCDLGHGSFLVFDVPIRSALTGWGHTQLPYMSSCLVRPSATPGLSEVVWVELIQFRHEIQFRHDEVDPLLLDFLKDGGGFGSRRWFCALSRECRRLSSLGQLCKPVRNTQLDERHILAGATPSRLLLLADEMSKRFFSRLSSARLTSGYATLIPTRVDLLFSFDRIIDSDDRWTCKLAAKKPVWFETIPPGQLFALCGSPSSSFTPLLQIPSHRLSRKHTVRKEPER